MVSSPPQLAAASTSMGTWVGYTGLGGASTSAVGLVGIAPVPGSPEALVKGTAYGQLHVSATVAEKSAIFAADAAIGAGKHPPREVRVQLVGAEGAGTPTSIRGPGGHASRASVARDQNGAVLVTYNTDSGVYAALLRCDD